jgi:hypothetical protein
MVREILDIAGFSTVGAANGLDELSASDSITPV